MLDMKALQSSLKGVRGRGKRLNENCHNHSNKPSRPRGSLLSGKGEYVRGVGLNEDGGIFREGGGGGGGPLESISIMKVCKKKGA